MAYIREPLSIVLFKRMRARRKRTLQSCQAPQAQSKPLVEQVEMRCREAPVGRRAAALLGQRPGNAFVCRRKQCIALGKLRLARRVSRTQTRRVSGTRRQRRRRLALKLRPRLVQRTLRRCQPLLRTKPRPRLCLEGVCQLTRLSSQARKLVLRLVPRVHLVRQLVGEPLRLERRRRTRPL